MEHDNDATNKRQLKTDDNDDDGDCKEAPVDAPSKKMKFIRVNSTKSVVENDTNLDAGIEDKTIVDDEEPSDNPNNKVELTQIFMTQCDDVDDDSIADGDIKEDAISDTKTTEDAISETKTTKFDGLVPYVEPPPPVCPITDFLKLPYDDEAKRLMKEDPVTHIQKRLDVIRWALANQDEYNFEGIEGSNCDNDMQVSYV